MVLVLTLVRWHIMCSVQKHWVHLPEQSQTCAGHWSLQHGLSVPAGSMSGACNGIILKSICAFFAYLGSFTRPFWSTVTGHALCQEPPVLRGWCFAACMKGGPACTYWSHVFLQHHMPAMSIRKRARTCPIPIVHGPRWGALLQ